MDFEFQPGVCDSHSESMDHHLSRAWCNFAVHEAFQAQSQDQSLFLLDIPINMFDNDPQSPSLRMDKGAKMDNAKRSIPSWKSNDIKSWIWMQPAMHPELNYNSCFRKKWSEWKIIVLLKPVSIKKSIKDIKEKRKECRRLQTAEVHAAVPVAGVAASLAAIAASDHQNSTSSDTSKEAAIAAAAALVAAECAKVAEDMGAKREQLKNVISSAMS